MKGRYNPLLLAIICLGLCCALWLNWTRHQIEEANNQVEMAMEYENLRRLAALEGLPEEEVLAKFKEAGITSLMVFDTNLRRLQEKNLLQVATGGELKQAQSLGSSLGAFQQAAALDLIEENAVYLAPGKDQSSFSDALTDLRLRYGAARVKQIGTGDLYMVTGSTKLQPDDRYDEPFGLLQHPLGLPRADLQKVQQAGFRIIIRPQNYTNVTEEQINSIFQRLQDSGIKAAAYMPCGKEVVGFPSKLDYMGQKMQEQGQQLIMLEHYTQLRFAQIDGLINLAEHVNYKASRAYVIDGVEQKKLSIGQALRRWALTDQERNIRVNYIRPFYLPREGQDLLSQNLKYVRDIKESVANRGYSFGEAGLFSASAEAYAPYFPSKLSLVPVAAAIVAGLVLYLSLLYPLGSRWQLVLWLVLTGIACGLLILGRGLLTRQLLALTAACVFPVLSLSVCLRLWQQAKKNTSLLFIIGQGLWQLAAAIALSLVGGAFLSAILTDSRFLLEIDIYRGVKLTFIMPVLLTALLFMHEQEMLQAAGSGIKGIYHRVNSFLSAGLTLKHVAILGVLLFVAYYFVGRSGHTGGVPVPAIELKLRAFLEDVMYARPREKEFLIGHPCFFLGVMAAYYKVPKLWQLPLVCGAIIGQGSLVQTFCHMRTPVIMSLIRAIDGYAVGIVFGVVGVVVLWLLAPIALRLKRSLLGQ